MQGRENSALDVYHGVKPIAVDSGCTPNAHSISTEQARGHGLTIMCACFALLRSTSTWLKRYTAVRLPIPHKLPHLSVCVAALRQSLQAQTSPETFTQEIIPRVRYCCVFEPAKRRSTSKTLAKYGSSLHLLHGQDIKKYQTKVVQSNRPQQRTCTPYSTINSTAQDTESTPPLSRLEHTSNNSTSRVRTRSQAHLAFYYTSNEGVMSEAFANRQTRHAHAYEVLLPQSRLYNTTARAKPSSLLPPFTPNPPPLPADSTTHCHPPQARSHLCPGPCRRHHHGGASLPPRSIGSASEAERRAGEPLPEESARCRRSVRGPSCARTRQLRRPRTWRAGPWSLEPPVAVRRHLGCCAIAVLETHNAVDDTRETSWKAQLASLILLTGRDQDSSDELVGDVRINTERKHPNQKRVHSQRGRRNLEYKNARRFSSYEMLKVVPPGTNALLI